MKFSLKAVENRAFHSLFRRDPSGRLQATTVRLTSIFLISEVLASIMGGALQSLMRLVAWSSFALLAICLGSLLFRWLFGRVFWTVRSRLIVLCLLMGLAPIVLFTILGSVATYIFCGQFATSIAAERIDDELLRLQGHSRTEVFLASHATVKLLGAPPAAASRPGPNEVQADELLIRYSDGKRLADVDSMPGMANTTYFREADLPGWIRPGFKGVVTENGRLFLCGSGSDPTNGHVLVTLACEPFRHGEVEAIAEGLGHVRITTNLLSDAPPEAPAADKEAADEDAEDAGKSAPAAAGKAGQPDAADDADTTNDSSQAPAGRRPDPSSRRHLIPHPHIGPRPPRTASDDEMDVSGGTLPAAVNFFDLRVYFSSPLHTVAWVSGDEANTWLFVVSRPVVLYKRLFASSVRTGNYVRTALIITGSVFALLELLACFIAIMLSRTITRSIGDLYDATMQIDKGNLDHRVPVRRKDQLAVLAASFNTMTGSLKGLLVQQREKDRMESELKVAQEVQNNLFPHSGISLPGFELFGICQPARTIGGDYYDFIPFGTSQLYLALGDISGKGISAALLMASLHSAVRAYRSSADPETIASDLIPRNELNVSPGRLLGLLNEHLYTSTQASKYATLFLACYDSSTRELTYSNGGHLPPILLCATGEVKHLTCGGSVVGLLEGMQYEEETVHLAPGDLLIAYSDGLTEPEKDTVDFGEDRLVDVIRRNQILSLPDVAAHAIKEVRDWIGDGEQPDDMTLVLARLS